MARSRFVPDNFTFALLATVTLASFLPARGEMAHVFESLTTVAICLLFFFHGAKLSREAVLDGIRHWRLHLMVFAATFVLFPLLGLALKPVLSPLMTPDLYTGILFLCMLPATVQSAIAFTSMARGNVPAAVCSASASTLLGVLITPVLVGLTMSSRASSGSGGALESVGQILLQLIAPFLAGHLLRPWIRGFVSRHASSMMLIDRGSILLVVYTAFSAAVVQGLWTHVAPSALAGLLAGCAVLLAAVLFVTTWSSRQLGFSKEDEITIVFCGSKKSLVSGIPLAKVLFASQAVGAIVLPLMMFHQMQLMVCAVLAQRYARRVEPAATGPASTFRAAE